MKVLSNLAGAHLTSDEVADAVIAYSDAMALAGGVELIDVPVFDGAGARFAPIVVGSLARLTARPPALGVAVTGEARKALRALTREWISPRLGLHQDGTKWYF